MCHRELKMGDARFEVVNEARNSTFLRPAVIRHDARRGLRS
jgi:hypothetical protein